MNSAESASHPFDNPVLRRRRSSILKLPAHLTADAGNSILSQNIPRPRRRVSFATSYELKNYDKNEAGLYDETHNVPHTETLASAEMHMASFVQETVRFSTCNSDSNMNTFIGETDMSISHVNVDSGEEESSNDPLNISHYVPRGDQSDGSASTSMADASTLAKVQLSTHMSTFDIFNGGEAPEGPYERSEKVSAEEDIIPEVITEVAPEELSQEMEISSVSSLESLLEAGKDTSFRSPRNSAADHSLFPSEQPTRKSGSVSTTGSESFCALFGGGNVTGAAERSTVQMDISSEEEEAARVLGASLPRNIAFSESFCVATRSPVIPIAANGSSQSSEEMEISAVQNNLEKSQSYSPRDSTLTELFGGLRHPADVRKCSLSPRNSCSPRNSRSPRNSGTLLDGLSGRTQEKNSDSPRIQDGLLHNVDLPESSFLALNLPPICHTFKVSPRGAVRSRDQTDMTPERSVSKKAAVQQNTRIVDSFCTIQPATGKVFIDSPTTYVNSPASLTTAGSNSPGSSTPKDSRSSDLPFSPMDVDAPFEEPYAGPVRTVRFSESFLQLDPRISGSPVRHDSDHSQEMDLSSDGGINRTLQATIMNPGVVDLEHGAEMEIYAEEGVNRILREFAGSPVPATVESLERSAEMDMSADNVNKTLEASDVGHVASDSERSVQMDISSEDLKRLEAVLSGPPKDAFFGTFLSPSQQSRRALLSTQINDPENSQMSISPEQPAQKSNIVSPDKSQSHSRLSPQISDGDIRNFGQTDQPSQLMTISPIIQKPFPIHTSTHNSPASFINATQNSLLQPHRISTLNCSAMMEMSSDDEISPESEKAESVETDSLSSFSELVVTGKSNNVPSKSPSVTAVHASPICSKVMAKFPSSLQKGINDLSEVMFSKSFNVVDNLEDSDASDGTGASIDEGNLSSGLSILSAHSASFDSVDLTRQFAELLPRRQPNSDATFASSPLDATVLNNVLPDSSIIHSSVKKRNFAVRARLEGDRQSEPFVLNPEVQRLIEREDFSVDEWRKEQVEPEHMSLQDSANRLDDEDNSVETISSKTFLDAEDSSFERPEPDRFENLNETVSYSHIAKPYFGADQNDESIDEFPENPFVEFIHDQLVRVLVHCHIKPDGVGRWLFTISGRKSMMVVFVSIPLSEKDFHGAFKKIHCAAKMLFGDISQENLDAVVTGVDRKPDFLLEVVIALRELQKNEEARFAPWPRLPPPPAWTLV